MEKYSAFRVRPLSLALERVLMAFGTGSWHGYPGSSLADHRITNPGLTFAFKPFLTPVPPLGSDATAKVLLPFAYIIGIVRTALVLVLALAYAVLVHGVCLVLVGVRTLHADFAS